MNRRPGLVNPFSDFSSKNVGIEDSVIGLCFERQVVAHLWYEIGHKWMGYRPELM